MANFNDPEQTNRLSSIEELEDFEVAEGDPDPRGWEVLGADGQRIGAVEDLIVDTTAMKVRYLDCNVDEERLGLDTTNRHVLIPVGFARLDEEDNQVVVDRISSQDVGDLPAFSGLPLARDDENALLNRFTSGRSGTGSQAEGETRLSRSEEELSIGKRQVEAGEVDVHKRVETERVREPVTVRREEVDIERRPVSGAQASSSDIREEEFRIPVREEEVIAEKRPRVKEEYVVRKHPVERTETVETELRKERIDIDREGGQSE